MTASRRSALWMLLVTAVIFCSVPAPSQPPTFGSVGGKVYLRDTHGPAAGAFVSLFSPVSQLSVPEEGEYVLRDDDVSPKELHGTVANDGSFEIGNVPPGEYTVMLYKPGYIAQDPRYEVILPSFLPFTRVRILPGQRKTVELELKPGGSIEGRVTFTDGKPAHTGLQVAAEISIDVEVETATGRFNRYGGAAHTDSNGHYSIDGLPTGRYIVFAALPGKMVTTTRGSVGTSGRIVFAPSSGRASRAEVVEVKEARSHGGVDLQFSTQGLHSVAGIVVDSTGKPITDGLIRLYPEGEPDLSLAAPPGIHGEFSFADLPDDEYTVRAEFHGEIRFLGMTEDKTGMRMLRQKAPFLPVSTEVLLSGKDVEALVLRAQTAP